MRLLLLLDFELSTLGFRLRTFGINNQCKVNGGDVQPMNALIRANTNAKLYRNK